jgi:lysophospholipase L1-like esterase
VEATTMVKQDAVSRRGFLGATALAGGVAGSGVFNASPARAEEAGTLKEHDVILFQGDSITDAGRARNNNANDAGALGHSYPHYIATYLLATQPKHDLKFFNRGISGHKVPDLDARWKTDTVDLKPTVVSILVGVNDIWHKLNGNYKGTVEDYDKGYAALLERTSKELPGVRLVVIEPFVLRCGAVSDKWFPEFDERRAVAKKVAEKAGAVFVPMHSIFEGLSKEAPPNYWAGDGVHPSLAGHGAIAKAWVEAVKP